MLTLLDLKKMVTSVFGQVFLKGSELRITTKAQDSTLMAKEYVDVM